MAATLYRIDGTPRTYSQLFPTGAGATYDDYGASPFNGEPRTVQLGQRSRLGLPQTTSSALPGVSTTTIGHPTTARLPQRSTLRIRKE